MNSRLTPRTTRDERDNREPIATSECPDSRGATNGISALRSVDRSTSQYATTVASLMLQVALSARPRPFCARWTTRTLSMVWASSTPTARVLSVLALSAMVMRAEYGNAVCRCSARRRTQPARSASSLYTGTTTSRSGREGVRSTRTSISGASVGSGIAVPPDRLTVSVVMDETLTPKAAASLRPTCQLAVSGGTPSRTCAPRARRRAELRGFASRRRPARPDPGPSRPTRGRRSPPSEPGRRGCAGAAPRARR